MLETPVEFIASSSGRMHYPENDLRRFRYHTGTPLAPLSSDEVCPVLFRDIGPVAMVDFLQGRLERLAGPFSPIIYMRTEDYREPYVDYAKIGRLVFLRPLTLHPFHSGTDFIYIADANCCPPRETIGFIPGHLSLVDAAKRVRDTRTTQDLRLALGGHEYDEACRDSLEQQVHLNSQHDETERFAEPIRRKFQSPASHERDRIRRTLEEFGISETDLCSAWHHLPQDRRDYLRQELPNASRCLRFEEASR